MKVVTSCRGRFHIYDQARQLHRKEILYRLIVDYPKSFTSLWGIPREKVEALLVNGLLAEVGMRCGRVIGPVAQDRLRRAIHDGFSRRLAKYIPPEADIFIGLSAFSLEAVRRARELGVTSIVDHGSLHERLERKLLLEERQRWGLPLDVSYPPFWLIQKEQEEFLIADRIFVLSSAAKRSLVDEGVPPQKIFVNPLGVDLQSFSPGEKSDSVFRVIQCGGIVERKGVQYLMRAFYELGLPQSELWFVGGGRAGSVLEPIIRRYARSNILFKGAFPQNALRRLYQESSVAVLASVADGFGMVVPQAMACGLPVIVTDHVGASDVIQNGESGMVIPARDVESLKEALLFLYRNEEARREMGRAARRAVQHGLSWDAYGNRLAGFLGDLRAGG